MLDPYYLDWLNLVVRWIHMITGVAWIGASFYFNWLEGSLDRRQKPGSGLAGDLWAVHGGGFYHVVKYEVSPPQLPETLHWFKWEAYTTWLSGFVLLTIVYYCGARSYLIDPQVAVLEPWQAISLGIACLVGMWFVYDGICRVLGKHPRAVAGLMFTLVCLLAYALSHVFSSRGAYMHVGAVLGTLMAANVWRVIIPAQKVMVAALSSGQTPDGAVGKKALQRSLHNNYMTLPVLFVMISNHFPQTYGHRWNWAILATLFLIGAGTRHYFNLKNRGKRHPWMLPAACLALFALAYVTKQRPAPEASAAASGATAPVVDFAEVQGIIRQRCIPCHSAQATDSDFTVAPNGVKFDTPEEIHSRLHLIKMRVVDAKTMPLANKTGMTEAERQRIAAWLAAGAPR